MNKELQDKAWAVLPKEFKEEVKLEFNNAELRARLIHDSHLRGEHYKLRDLFGEQNLISDTEGEKILIVSRKAAKEFYDKYLGDNLCNVNRLSLRKDINILFGGKCLSYEYAEADLEPYTNRNQRIYLQKVSETKNNENHIVGREHKLQNEKYNVDGETYLLEPRVQIATAAMQGLLNATSVERFTLRIKPSAIAKAAVEYADALLAEINRKGSGDGRDNN